MGYIHASTVAAVPAPDGSLLAAVYNDLVYFWKTSTGQLIYMTEAKIDPNSPEGQQLIPLRGVLTHVLQNQAGTWMIVASQNTERSI